MAKMNAVSPLRKLGFFRTAHYSFQFKTKFSYTKILFTLCMLLLTS